MKSFIAVSALAAVALAQTPNVSSLPSCGVSLIQPQSVPIDSC